VFSMEAGKTPWRSITARDITETLLTGDGALRRRFTVRDGDGGGRRVQTSSARHGAYGESGVAVASGQEGVSLLRAEDLL
jgi:hypothetical protein